MLLKRFYTFASKVKEILEQKAHRKGYSISKEDQGKELFKFVGEHFGGHPLGEIVYKCVRYRYGGDIKDLEKIAAWAYLMWQGAHEGAVGTYIEGSMRDFTFPDQGPATRPGKPVETAEIPLDPPLSDFGEKLAAEQGQRVRNFMERHKRPSLIEAMAREAATMAHSESSDRPKVWEADPIRLAALVAEEVGEATKEALDATRTWEREGDSNYIPIRLAHMRKELLQTASIAIIAAAVIKSREK